MITVVSDTHGTDDHRLEDRTLAAVREADLVIHAGDFTTEAVLDDFRAEVAGTGDLAGDGRDLCAGGDGGGHRDGDDGDRRDGGDDGDGDETALRDEPKNGSECGAGEFVAVAGNNDDDGVRARLGSTRVVDRAGIRFVVVHGHEHDETALSLLGRQEAADVVVVGHSHRPGWDPAGAVPVLNPGSHADPRWYRPAHAELATTAEGLGGRLVTPGGEVFSTFDLAVSGRG